MNRSGSIRVLLKVTNRCRCGSPADLEKNWPLARWNRSRHEPSDDGQDQQGRVAAAGARGSLFNADRGFPSRRAAPVPVRHAVAMVRAAAQGSAGALLHQLTDRTLLV